jgi:hypothetical protein
VWNYADVAAFRASAQSLESASRIYSAVWPPFSLVSETRFQETEKAVAETGSIKRLLGGETEDLALTRPFGDKLKGPRRARAFQDVPA